MSEYQQDTNERVIKIAKILSVTTIFLFCGFFAAFLYFRSQCPAYFFINDTDSEVNIHLDGGSSPLVPVILAPGESKIVKMPALIWCDPYLPEGVETESKFIFHKLSFIKTIHLSTFPDDWLE